MSLQFIYTTPLDPLAAPLVEELTLEYDTRYGEFYQPGEPREMQKYPAELFTPGHGGNFLLLLEGGRAVSGGAFKRFDAYTAEFKRVWTHSRRRRQGLARLVLAELEAQAWRQGYREVYLTTGFRQPEAANLYLGHSYLLQPDPDGGEASLRRLAFRKPLQAPAQDVGAAVQRAVSEVIG